MSAANFIFLTLVSTAVAGALDSLMMGQPLEREMNQPLEMAMDQQFGRKKDQNQSGTNQTTEQILAQINTVSNRTTVLRGPHCSDTFDYAYIRPRSSMEVQSLIKENKNPPKRCCGWIFWTDVGNMLNVSCTNITIRGLDVMIVYDVDNAVTTAFTEADAGPISRSFDSANVAIGLEAYGKSNHGSFVCTLTASSARTATTNATITTTTHAVALG